jgi:uncharacterized protein
MLFNALIVQVLSVIFIATVFRSAFGFGESLVAVPLLALWLPLNVAVPLSVLVSVTIALVVVVQDWNKIHFRSAGGLILYTLIGIPLGLLLLLYINERVVKAVLGAVITIFSIYLIAGKELKELKRDNTAWLFGCGLFEGYSVVLTELMGHHWLSMVQKGVGRHSISGQPCRAIF